MIAGSLFSGVGGLDFGAERAGFRVAWQCEANEWRRGVLAVRFPGGPVFDDVSTLTGPPAVDVLIGGFPCQNLSLAGKGEGLSGSRSGLWFEYLRLIVELKPRAVLIENVLGLLSRGLDVVVAGLNEAGYSVEATRMRAGDLGAPHRRERIFIVAVRGAAAVGGLDDFGGSWTALPGKPGRWRPDRPDRPDWPTVTVAERANSGGAVPGPRRPPLSELVKDWPTPTKTDADKNVGYLGGNPSLRIAVRDDSRAWPTVTRKGNDNVAGRWERSGDGLGTAIREPWPTPRASDGLNPGASDSSEGSPPLPYAVREWATPQARDWKSTSPATKENTRPLSEQVGGELRTADAETATQGPLSPWWTESLMGFPFGWTDPTNAAPSRFPDWPMGRGQEQHPWEPPRTVPARSCADRQDRIEALGDAVVPACAEIAALRMRAHLDGRVRGPSQSSMFGGIR